MVRSRNNHSKNTLIIVTIIIFIFLLFFLYKTGNLNKYFNEFLSSLNNNNKNSSDELEVHFINVGQGDAILIKYKHKNILIDGGENKYGKKVVDYLSAVGVKDLWYVIGTHPDSDHIGGLDDVINAYKVSNIIDSGYVHNTVTYKDYIAAIENEVKYSGANFISDDEDMKIYFDDKVYLQIIETGDDFADLNNYSIVSLLVYNDIEFFLSGDMEKEAEANLVKRVKTENLSISANVYKAAHHGSKTSSSSELLNYLKPQYIIVSASLNNKYNHPHDEAMERFRKHTNNIFTTYESCPNIDDLCAIVAKTDGISLKIDAKQTVVVDKSKSENMSFSIFNKDVYAGQNIIISVLGEPNTLYSIELTLPSGTISTSNKLIPKMSDEFGNVSWEYLFNANSKLGTGKITVKNVITEETITTYYEIIENTYTVNVFFIRKKFNYLFYIKETLIF